MIDKAKEAIDVFDVWLALFPAEQGEITRVWQENKVAFELLRDFRNTTAFHGNKALSEHLRVRAQVLKSKPVEKASQALFDLSIRMLRIETASTDFKDAVKAKCTALGVDPAGFLKRFGY